MNSIADDMMFTCLSRISELKATMIAKGLTAGKAPCPWCGKTGTFSMVLAGRKNHVHAACSACDRSMME